MNTKLRFIATTLIWMMVSFVSVMSIAIPGSMTSGAVILTLIGMILAYATTRTLWQAEEAEKIIEADQRIRHGKRKRGSGDSKAEMLLSLMDDDEREAFKRALQEQMLQGANRLRDDGELADDEVPLTDLLYEDKRQH